MLLVFVHGYSVTSFDTYGGLPQRLLNEGQLRKIAIKTTDIFLGRYISFNDQVLLSDIARALEHAVKEQLPAGEPCVFVSHSTGGPLLRTWWRDFYFKPGKKCPMTHLIMLAPANHGSALAQLGKSRLSRVRSWLEGLEPGQGVLHWLELGSEDAWELNSGWIRDAENQMQATGTFPFVITGQDIDRKMYDHINSYTGEPGSDGVVRVASANLNNAWVTLTQSALPGERHQLKVSSFMEAAATPLKIVHRRSHSGDSMGIMRSVKPEVPDEQNEELIQAVFDCISVKDRREYIELGERFTRENHVAQENMRIETVHNTLRKKMYFHDRHSMVIFRVRDHEGRALDDFDLIITGDDDDPDQLPVGFFADRQCNKVHANTLTYYFNYDVLTGRTEILDAAGNILRPSTPPLRELGLRIVPRPNTGFVRYETCAISASPDLFRKIIRPNATTLVDIQLQRMVSDENFRFEKLAGNSGGYSFRETRPGKGTVG